MVTIQPPSKPALPFDISENEMLSPKQYVPAHSVLVPPPPPTQLLLKYVARVPPFLTAQPQRKNDEVVIIPVIVPFSNISHNPIP